MKAVPSGFMRLLCKYGKFTFDDIKSIIKPFGDVCRRQWALFSGQEPSVTVEGGVALGFKTNIHINPFVEDLAGYVGACPAYPRSSRRL